MNILFLTVTKIDDYNYRSIYTDLLRKFIEEGHNVFIASTTERKHGEKTHLIKINNNAILKIRTLNIQRTNFIEKGLGTILLEYQFKKAINKHYKNIRFDLVLYSTPPITITSVIGKIKKRDKALTYLLLKDIFPQNAVDLAMISNKSFIYRYFRNKEKKLYSLSDYIGCMSPANVDFVLKNNSDIDAIKVEVCPNSVELETELSVIDKSILKNKYDIPQESTVFIYGGNLGKPQGLDFLLDILDINRNKKDRYFLIVGSGTEYGKIAEWFDVNKPDNAKLISALPKLEYDELVRSCDVGLIFLDPRFTIPNYPSRLLSYLEYKMPVLLATDLNTDIGSIAEENGYGLWCENGNIVQFNSLLDTLTSKSDLRTKMGERGYKFLKENYTVDKTYDIIMRHL